MTRTLIAALPNLSAKLSPFLPRCAAPGCRPRSRLLSLSWRSEGTSIGSNWYCSASCFEEAVRLEVARLCFGHNRIGPDRQPRMPLGLMALSLGYITPEQLREALDYQGANGGRIGEILVTLGALEPAQVTAALAAQWGHPFLSLKNRPLQPFSAIPIKLMERYSMLPVQFVSQTNKLVLGFSEFVEHQVLMTIEKMLDCTVVPCFITEEDFKSNFGLFRLQRSNEEVVFEQPSSVAEIGRVARSYAWQISAQSAKFGICGGFVWTKLQAPRVSMDLLSRI